MSTEPLSAKWLQDKFAETGRQQVELVSYLNSRGVPIDATKMSKTVAGTRRVQTNERYPIWAFFGGSPEEFADISSKDSIALTDRSNTNAESLTKKSVMPNAGLPERIAFDKTTMPILGQSLGSQPNAKVLFNGQRLGEIERPQRLAHVPNAYATYVHGTSMEPRYEPGEIVLVNPTKPLRKGNYVVAQVHDNDDDPPYGYIKKFISFTDSELVLEQLNPPEDEDKILRFPRNKVVSVHRIVGTLDE